MATVEQHAPQTHNGSVASGEGIAVENPATGEIVATVADLGAEAVAEMAARGRAAQPGWEAFGFEGRARVMLRAQKWLMDNAEQVVQTIVSETGKTHEDATFAEIAYGGGAFGFWAKNAAEYLGDERVKSSQVLVKGKKLILRFRPLGLIGVIGPWNYPLTNSFGDCIPALMAGNSVILKPSEVTPLTSLLLSEAMLECGLPENVLQIATGRGATGAALIEQVDMIMFTGSTKTGRKVAEAAAGRLIPSSLELGGKDPMIVLSDADLERAANFATYYSMQNAGQTCISIERVYVEEPVYDEFVAKVTEKVRALRVGKPDGFGSVEVGAITFPPQLDTIKDHVADAIQKGARVLTGGQQVAGPGRFFEPTVLVDVDHSMKIMTDETFGPTLPIMKVRDPEEAVRLPTTRPTGWRRRCSRATPRAARRSRAASRRAPRRSTTR
jgi:acyl-CoA reductase-like NAD-dependent aldehyde dehydrogenase